MQKTNCLLMFPFLLATASVTRASVVVDYQPFHTGGPASDTLFIDQSSGNPVWNLAADRFTLGSAVAIQTVKWWGYYYADNPPAGEVMRVRFYEPRADGLPGSILYEQQFTNPARTTTGIRMPVPNLPHEFKYSVDLSSPPSLVASRQYWLEVVALGDANSLFVWENSLADRVGFVVLNPLLSDWHVTTLGVGTAFQLISVPEPATLALAAAGLAFWRRSCRL